MDPETIHRSQPDLKKLIFELSIPIYGLWIYESKDDDLISGDCEDDGPTAAEETSNETFFEAGAQSSTFDHFKRLMRCSDIVTIPDCALNLIKLVDLGKLEKGAVSSAAHLKSKNGRWFSQKKTAGETANVDEESEAPICIQQDSLIQVECKRRHAASVTSGLFPWRIASHGQGFHLLLKMLV